MIGAAPPRDRKRRFVNWARTVRTAPLTWREPTSEADVIAAVRERPAKLRVVGAGHSWSAIAAPEHVAMTLARLAGVIAVGDGTVTVHGGTRLGALNDELAARGLALPIVGSIAQQSVAGAIATGTHGSSLVHGNLASTVRALRIVTGTGDVLELATGDPRLAAARVHLGALGVITQVTLAVEPAFRLAETIEQIAIADVPAAVQAIAASAEYVKIWWLPHTRTATVFRYARSDAADTAPGAAARWVDDHVVNGVVFAAVLGITLHRRAWIPAINRAVSKVYLNRPPRIGRSDRMLMTAMPPRHRETEAVVPMALAGEAIARTVALIDREQVHVNFPLEARFVRGDDGWLSPAAGGDVCQLGAYSGQTRDIERFFAAFWREMRELRARPHWGKEFDHAPEELRAHYPRWDDFAALRRELDPRGMFGPRCLG